MQYNTFNSSTVLTSLGATFGTGGTVCDCSALYDLINDILSEMRTKFNEIKDYVDNQISSLTSRLNSNEFVKNDYKDTAEISLNWKQKVSGGNTILVAKIGNTEYGIGTFNSSNQLMFPNGDKMWVN